MENLKSIRPQLILYLIVLASLILGVFIVPDFGVSMDDDVETAKSRLALTIYQGKLSEDPLEAFEGFSNTNDKYYGTSSLVLFRLVEETLFPGRDHQTMVVAHYGYFVFFQAAVIAVYFLLRHFVNEWASLIGTLIFGTQPIFLGHAFINSKDIPLLAVFLAAVVIGFRFIDRLEQRSGDAEPFRTEDKKSRILFTCALGLLLILLWSGPWLATLVRRVVEFAYLQPDSFIGSVFSSQTSSGSLEGYQALAHIQLLEGFRWMVLFAALVLVFMFHQAGKRKLFGNRVDLFLLLAAGVWGFAISTRVIALAAGGIVGIYGLVKLGKKAILPLGFYTAAASAASVISWPFLWVYGLRGIVDALLTFSDYGWFGGVLFEGVVYGPHDVPGRYLLQMMALQFTEPVVILGLAGFGLSLYLLFAGKIDRTKTILMYAWFGLPVMYTIIASPTVYNNFRQYLFITPPLFVMTGLAVEKLVLWVKKPVLVLGIVLLVLIPGVAPSVQLHPLQYAYYNSFTGGVQGAEGQYPLDYWNTSFVMAMEYVNENAVDGSHILVWKEDYHARIYAEKGKRFSFGSHLVVPVEEYGAYDYAIVSSDKYIEIEELRDYPVVHTVTLDDIEILSVLKISDSP